jgi:hypothetical protein
MGAPGLLDSAVERFRFGAMVTFFFVVSGLMRKDRAKFSLIS